MSDPQIVDIGPEIEEIKRKITDIADPAVRLGAIAQAGALVADLYAWLGPYAERGNTAREAMKQYAQKRGAVPNTVTIVSQKSGLTPATIRRLTSLKAQSK